MITMCSVGYRFEPGSRFSNQITTFKVFTECGIVGTSGPNAYGDNCPGEPGLSGHGYYYFDEVKGPLITSILTSANCGENEEICSSRTEAQFFDTENHSASTTLNELWKELDALKNGEDPTKVYDPPTQ
jgi:hypothetical protein